MAQSVFVLMVLLAAGFLSTRIAKAIKLPHSVFLVILGVLSGIVLRQYHPAALESFSEQFPEIILYILLPPLVFESAYNMNFSDFKKDLVPIGSLAVIALIISTMFIGVFIHLIFKLDLIPCMVFGALISATDPVAVVSLFKEIGAPKRLNTLVEGESLLNDGTAIVLYRVLVGAVGASAVGFSLVESGALQFIQVALGGCLLGLALAVFTSWLLRLTPRSASAQLGITVAAAYLSFLIADHYLHVSGVIATLTIGLFLGARAKLELNKEALHGMHYIWEFLALSANIVVFFAVGATMNHSVLIKSLTFIPATLLIVYLARAVSVFVTVPVINKIPRIKAISFSYQFILLWGGLRGGLALGLVLMLPEHFPYRDLFLALATSVVFSTLFINALTIKSSLHLFKLDRLDPLDQAFYEKTVSLLKSSVLGPLQSAGQIGSLSPSLIAAHTKTAPEAPEHSAGAPEYDSEEAGLHFAVNSLLLNEKHYYDEKREDGIISKVAYQHLVQSVTDRLDRFSAGSLADIESQQFDFGSPGSLMQKIGNLIPQSEPTRIKSLTTTLEVLLHLRFALEEAADKTANNTAKELCGKWIEEAKNDLEEFYKLYTHFGAAVQSFFIANTINASSEAMLNDFHETSIISGAVFTRVQEDIENAHVKALAEAHKLLRPSTAYLLSRVPLFAGLPDEAVHRFASGAKNHVFKAGQAIVKEGTPGNSFFLITAGMLEVDNKQLAASGKKPRLFAGDFFGEMSLLFHQPRSATVHTLTTTELIEISSHEFLEIMKEFPAIREEIEKTASSRRDSAH